MSWRFSGPVWARSCCCGSTAAAAQPLRSQLEAGLREAIRGGRLQGGERLPSSRELARELGISRGLVQECYSQLLSEGYLTSQVGSATRVAAGAYRAPAPPAAAPAAAAAADRRLPLRSPRPGELPARRLGLGDPGGLRHAPPPRTSTTATPAAAPCCAACSPAYLRRVRAAAADPGHIVVSTGFAQGVILVLAGARPGRRPVRRVRGSRVRRRRDERDHAGRRGDGHARASTCPWTTSGWTSARWRRSGAQAVVVTPAHQSPTGVVLAARRRHALVEWARRNDGFIIEDDYDSEFRYDREPVGVLQGLAPDRVFTIGTASKALAPAVRLGWVLAPPSLAAAVAAEKRISDRGSSTLDQLALAALLESGRYDRHLRRMRDGLCRPARRAHRRPGPRMRRGVRLTGSGRRVPRRRAPAGRRRTSGRWSRPRASGRSACTG